MTDEERKNGINYLTFKGLGYTPMLGGVPLFSALGMLGGGVIALICLIVGAPFLAIFVLIVDLCVYFFLKIICENNNKAPQFFALRFKGFLAKIKYGAVIKVDLGVDSDERKKKFRQQYKSLFRSK